jgi:hypothetical protein
MSGPCHPPQAGGGKILLLIRRVGYTIQRKYGLLLNPKLKLLLEFKPGGGKTSHLWAVAAGAAAGGVHACGAAGPAAEVRFVLPRTSVFPSVFFLIPKQLGLEFNQPVSTFRLNFNYKPFFFAATGFPTGEGLRISGVGWNSKQTKVLPGFIRSRTKLLLWNWNR